MRILPPSVALAVTLPSEVVSLALCELLGFVPVDPVKAFGLDELVDLGGGDGCEDFLKGMCDV